MAPTTKSEKRLAAWIAVAMLFFAIGVEPCWLSFVLVVVCTVCIAALMGGSDWDE
jgi:uncharacterized oligopeptide transporter (OPT) family protein